MMAISCMEIMRTPNHFVVEVNKGELSLVQFAMRVYLLSVLMMMEDIGSAKDETKKTPCPYFLSCRGSGLWWGRRRSCLGWRFGG